MLLARVLEHKYKAYNKKLIVAFFAPFLICILTFVYARKVYNLCYSCHLICSFIVKCNLCFVLKLFSWIPEIKIFELMTVWDFICKLALHFFEGIFQNICFWSKLLDYLLCCEKNPCAYCGLPSVHKDIGCAIFTKCVPIFTAII